MLVRKRSSSILPQCVGLIIAITYNKLMCCMVGDWGRGIGECVRDTISGIGYFDTLGPLEVYSKVIV